jgi:hypothetical protein
VAISLPSCHFLGRYSWHLVYDDKSRRKNSVFQNAKSLRSEINGQAHAVSAYSHAWTKTGTSVSTKWNKGYNEGRKLIGKVKKCDITIIARNLHIHRDNKLVHCCWRWEPHTSSHVYSRSWFILRCVFNCVEWTDDCKWLISKNVEGIGCGLYEATGSFWKVMGRKMLCLCRGSKPGRQSVDRHYTDCDTPDPFVNLSTGINYRLHEQVLKTFYYTSATCFDISWGPLYIL